MTTPKADIKINATSAAWGTVTGVRASRGIGIARIAVDLDVSPRVAEAAGALLSIEGAVRVRTPSTEGFLCDVAATRQYGWVPELGGSATFSLEGTLGLRQLKAIEDKRTAGVTLDIALNGHLIVDGDHAPFWNASVEYEIEQSAWVKNLSGWGYRNLILLEFDQPQTARTNELAQAFTYLSEARERFLEHQPRHTVESLRQCLASLVGRKADDVDELADPSDSLRAAQKDARPGGNAGGYNARFELARRALKFASDMAAHPEVGETTLIEAETLLIMTAGILFRFSHP